MQRNGDSIGLQELRQIRCRRMSLVALYQDESDRCRRYFRGIVLDRNRNPATVALGIDQREPLLQGLKLRGPMAIQGHIGHRIQSRRKERAQGSDTDDRYSHCRWRRNGQESRWSVGRIAVLLAAVQG